MDTQDGPLQEGSAEATDDERLDGIVEQMRADIDVGNADADVVAMLRQRVADAGVNVTEERIRQLASEVQRGGTA